MHKKSLSETVADEIRSRITVGAWAGSLPGIRALASEFDVSPVTIDLAFKMLERDGIIAPAIQGKRRRIQRSDSPSACNGTPKEIAGLRVGYLTSSESFTACSPEERQFIERLQHQFGSRDAHMTPLYDSRAFSLKRVRNHLEKLLDLHPMNFWIVAWPSAALADGFSQQGVGRIFVGSVPPDPDVDMFSPLPTPFSKLIRTLVRHGHSRIILPVPELWHRDADQPSWAEAEIQSQLRDSGLKASAFNTPRFGATPDSFLRCLADSFAHTPPTAVITTSLCEHLACANFLQARSLRVPEDISLATLDWQPACDWITPRPTCFRTSRSAIAELLSARVEGAICGAPKEKPTVHGTDAEFLLTGSITDAP